MLLSPGEPLCYVFGVKKYCSSLLSLFVPLTFQAMYFQKNDSNTTLLVCGLWGSTPDLVPLSLDEMGAQQEVSGGPLNGHRLSLWWLSSVT